MNVLVLSRVASSDYLNVSNCCLGTKRDATIVVLLMYQDETGS